MPMTPIATPNAEGRFSAARNEAGVPVIRGATWLEALFGLGYMHAIDRGTQVLFGGTMAAGRAAEEIAGNDELLETDRFFRRIGLHLNLDDEADGLAPHAREQIEAYCAGVNCGMQSIGRTLPMWAIGYEPGVYNAQSVLLVGQLLSFGGLAVSQLQNERLLIELIHAGLYEEGIRELFSPRLDGVDFDLLRRVKIANKLSDEALELITDLPRLAGSNAWAISPGRSKSGHALLASDPHLEINRLPAIWYEAVLQWGDDDYVLGATLPGCPLFAIGRTPKLAWGVTYLKGDTIDYFIEDCRPGGATGWQYRRGEHWRDFELREEWIEQKGGSPQTLRVYHNAQGVIESDLDSEGPGLHLSIAWAGSQSGGGRAIASWLDVIAAESTEQGLDVVRQCAQPTLVWVMADRDGHIGKQACGRFPLRGGGYDGLTPIPAWYEENHWQGWLSPEHLPREFDPPRGFVASANEDINPPDGPLLITQPIPNYRRRRIDTCLEELTGSQVSDMIDLQYDAVSLQADDLLQIFLPHLPQGELRDRLAAWNRAYTTDSHEATLFQRLYRNVLVEIFGHEAGIGWRRMLYLSTRAGFSIMVVTAADRLLAKGNSVWWRKREKGDLIRRAAERLKHEEDAPWSAINNFHFSDRFFGGNHVGRLLGFDSQKYPMPGCHATPFQGHVLQTAKRESTFAPSYHFVCDLGEDDAWTNLPGGPSESRFSSYYQIDVPLWREGKYKQLAPARPETDVATDADKQ